jgi:RNA polymerase sigma factor (sigma-70 family)
MDDAALVEAARAGDKAAFAAIYDRYADRIHDFAASVLRDRQDAADVLQETFAAAAQHLTELRHPHKLRPWLFAIARHEAFARIRQRRRAVPVEDVPDVLVPDTEHPGPRPYDDAELRELVTDAAAGLDDRDRVVLELHLRQHLAGQELADAVGVTEGHAGVLLHRVKQRFERSVGAFLVARSRSGDCPDLDALLATWDGSFSPLVRKRVARHVEGCDVCGERRRRLVSPLAALAAVPLVPAPAAVRDRVLDRVQFVGSSTVPSFDGRDGFPRPMLRTRRARRTRPRVATAAALAVVLAFGGARFVSGSDGDDERVIAAAGAGGSEASEGAETLTSTTAIATTTTMGPPGRGPDAAADGTAGTPRTTVAPSGSASPGSTAPTGGAAGPLDGGGGGGPSGGAATTTTLGDTTGPSIGPIGASPASIHEDGSAQCQDTTSKVSATVNDASGVASVTLSWSVGGASGGKAMSGAGGAWSATAGPFEDDTIPPNSSQAISLTVVAKDAEGNSSSRTTSGALTLHDCTFS